MFSTKTSVIRFAGHLLAGISILLVLYFGRALFVPLFYGLFIAIVLYPVCKGLEKRHVPKSIAIFVSLIILFVLLSGLVWLLFFQFNAFQQDLPVLMERLKPVLADFQSWVSANFHVSLMQQDEWKQHAWTSITENSGTILSASFAKISSGLFMLFIIPVFAALFLYNRQSFVLFLEKLAGKNYNDSLHALLHKTMHTYFHFIKGMIFVYIIVGILNSIGLLALGIRHAILFGFLTAIMTIIPYIGIFISALLPITVAWITKDSIWYPIGVVAVFVFVQYLEANIIFPRVVASQLNISTLSSLVAIIAGGLLWGVNGMILFIPATGVLKLVSDYIPQWEPINILLRRN
jgi:predicted PurR-regulated permease PerM